MERSHIFFKELTIDENNIFTASMSEKNQVQNVLFRKSNKYAVTGLSLNQEIDNLIKVTDRNRKRILQELIENPLKEEKEDEHAFQLKIYNSIAYKQKNPRRNILL